MNKKPLFSVVIPAYNYAATLPRALLSVIEQSGDDYEVLVINDGSTDNTENVLKEMELKHPEEFTWVTRENRGPAATRNYGIDSTSGDWLIFLDADDDFMPDALHHFREKIKNNSVTRMIIGGHLSVEPDGEERYRKVKPFSEGAADIGNTGEKRFKGYLLDKTITPSNGATAMHRKIFETCRYPENFRNSEDIPVFAYALAKFNCISVDKPINRVHKHSDSLRHNLEYSDTVGTQIVDSVFNTTLIPDSLQKYKRAFSAQRSLSLFRTWYLSGNHEKALNHYKRAISADLTALLKFSYTKKVIYSFFKVNFKDT